MQKFLQSQVIDKGCSYHGQDKYLAVQDIYLCGHDMFISCSTNIISHKVQIKGAMLVRSPVRIYKRLRYRVEEEATLCS